MQRFMNRTLLYDIKITNANLAFFLNSTAPEFDLSDAKRAVD